MIELANEALSFEFPDVHPTAKCDIRFQRTLRIPDDDRTYPLPPSLGSFPLVHTEDHANRIPPSWLERQGVMLPMYQSEAMWIRFSSTRDAERGVSYPFAVKISAGKRSAVTGKKWSKKLRAKDYVVLPKQPWIDGFAVKEGVIRQFVAVPLGLGLTVEAQLSGDETFGGIQIEVFPMKRSEYEARFPKRSKPSIRRLTRSLSLEAQNATVGAVMPQSMGLGAGGQMKQQIFEDPWGLDVWDTENTSRVFVHLVNSIGWRAITQQEPPTAPFSAEDYKRYNLPWFDLYEEAPSLRGTNKTKAIKSVLQMEALKAQKVSVLPDNKSVEIPQTDIIDLSKKAKQVQDGRW